jgi:hypothetical protein
MQSKPLLVDSANFMPTTLSPIYQHFVCKICDSVISEGRQCANRNCSVLYCGKCVKEKVRSWRCNECGESKAPVDLHKRVRDFIEMLRFICPACNEEMMYKQMMEHIQNCEAASEYAKTGGIADDHAAASES